MTGIEHIPPFRRTFLTQALAGAGVVALSPISAVCSPQILVGNVTGLYSVQVAQVVTPATTAEVVEQVIAWPGKVAAGGGRYSMGGQAAIAGGLAIDMRALNKLVWIRPGEKAVRVQAGMRWRDLQDILDPLNLSVKTMQSYSNFTVGGSVSVNAHGRYLGHGPVGNTVRALQLVLADGSVIEASPRKHADLFRASIGGYGAVAILTEVELDVADNVHIERYVHEVSVASYVDYFRSKVLADSLSVMHNADLLPPHFDSPVCVTWRKTDRPLTEHARLVPRGDAYPLEQAVLFAVTELPGGETLRKDIVHPLMTARPCVKWLNHEASLDVAELEPWTRSTSTYALQEYFIPVRHFQSSAQGIARVLRAHGVMAVNVSIRHSPADTVSLLPWAKEEVFSFVLYYKQRTSNNACEEVGRWTRELIDLALENEGRYYLPYQLHARTEQFDRAYPEVSKLRKVKASADPVGKLSNELWAKYL
jgi:FAD/FMN-containing dehydrogenase